MNTLHLCGPFYKGTADNTVDLTITPLRNGSYVAQQYSEAAHYAHTLSGAQPRIYSYTPTRPLRLLAWYHQQTPPIPMSPNHPDAHAYARSHGYDGIAMDGQASGWHIIVLRPDIMGLATIV